MAKKQNRVDPFKENELFQFFQSEHDLLLTGDEINEIVHRVRDEDKLIDKMIEEKILTYRIINMVALGIIALIAYDMAIRVILALYILYNVGHIIYGFIKQRRSRLSRKKSNS